MAFIARFLSKHFFNLFSRSNLSSKVVEKFDNDYPLEGMGDHHRFLL